MMKRLMAFFTVLVFSFACRVCLAENTHRDQPIPLGESYRYSNENEKNGFSLITELLCVARGDTAKTLVRAWNRGNTASLGKNQEWILVKLRLDAVDAANEMINIKFRHFKFVSKSGVEYTRCVILDNPAEIRSFYAGSTQDAWVGCIVDKGDTIRLVYSPSSDTHIWFSLDSRAGSEMHLDMPIQKSSTGEKVMRIEERLLELGYFMQEPNTIFDDKTANAVRKFQRENSISSNGVVDQATATALFSGAINDE